MPSYIVGGRLQVAPSQDSSQKSQVSSWGRQTSQEVVVAFGHGANQQDYYQSVFVDASLQSGDVTPVGGRLMATNMAMALPQLEISRWGAVTSNEVQVFQANSYTTQYTFSYFYQSYYLGDASKAVPVIGGMLRASDEGCTQPWEQISQWGDISKYSTVPVQNYASTAPYPQGYVQQFFYVGQLADLGLTGVAADLNQTPFPAFTGGQALAFAAINAALAKQNQVLTDKLTDTRKLIVYEAQQYDTTTLGTAYGDLKPDDQGGLRFPTDHTDFTQDDWDQVKAQLREEVASAQHLIPLFLSNRDFLNTVFVVNLAHIMADTEIIGLDGGTNVVVDALNVLNAMVALMVPAAEGQAATIASLISIVTNLVVGEVGAHLTTASVQSESANLQSELTDWFQNAIDKNLTALVAIVSDWGKLSAAESLYAAGFMWPADAPSQEQIATHKYEVSIWQILLPIKYAVWSAVGHTWPNSPCVWQQPSNLPPVDATFMWISGKDSHFVASPADAVCAKLFGQQAGQLGVPVTDVYNNLNGWSLEHLAFSQNVPSGN